MKIVTTFDHPPIPVRDMDYSAIDEDTYDGGATTPDPIGRGRTADAAIRDLAEQCIDEYTDEQLDREALKAVERGDETTHRFITYIRELVAS